MFILDSLFLSGFRWVLNTIAAAAEAERDDDTVLRDQLLAAEMRRETGEISDEEFAEIEADLLSRIREIKTRRGGGSGPIAFGGQTTEGSTGAPFEIEATVSGDFHEPIEEAVAFPAEPVTAGARSGTVIERPLVERAPAPKNSRILRTRLTKPTRDTSRPRRPRRTSRTKIE
jgi:hypothetical protein